MSKEELYLDLLKRALTRDGFQDCFGQVPKNTRTLYHTMRWSAYHVLAKLVAPFGLQIVAANGRKGETMMGMGALNNLHQSLNLILNDGVPGDVCETGVWRGGGCIFMEAVLTLRNEMHRQVWVCDSFEGLPKPNATQYPADAGDELWQQELAVSVEQVKANFQKYNLLADNVRFLKGFFSESLPTSPIEQLALLRLDGDMYESTYVALKHLYPKVSSGGFVIVDDWGMIDGCNQAVKDYRRQEGISEPLQFIGYINNQPLGAFWRKR